MGESSGPCCSLRNFLGAQVSPPVRAAMGAARGMQDFESPTAPDLEALLGMGGMRPMPDMPDYPTAPTLNPYRPPNIAPVDFPDMPESHYVQPDAAVPVSLQDVMKDASAALADYGPPSPPPVETKLPASFGPAALPGGGPPAPPPPAPPAPGPPAPAPGVQTDTHVIPGSGNVIQPVSTGNADADKILQDAARGTADPRDALLALQGQPPRTTPRQTPAPSTIRCGPNEDAVWRGGRIVGCRPKRPR